MVVLERIRKTRRCDVFDVPAQCEIQIALICVEFCSERPNRKTKEGGRKLSVYSTQT